MLIFDGLTIWQKLSILTIMKGLPANYHAEIVKKAQEKSRDQQTLEKLVKNLERGDNTFGELLMIWKSKNTFQLMVNFRICYIFLVVIFAFSFPIRLVSETYNNIFRGRVSRIEV